MKKLLSSLLTRKNFELLGALIGLVLIIVAARELTRKEHSFEAVPYANQNNAPEQDLKPRVNATPALPAPLKPVPYEHRKAVTREVIELTPDNEVAILTPIDEDTASAALDKLLKLSARLKPSDPIYLVLNTPGGSVQAGLQFVDAVQALPQKVHTITIFAASMGFHIAQYLGDRLITPSGTLMSHRMRGGVEGQIPGELNVRANMVLDLADDEDSVAARRMGLDLAAYRTLIQDEYWVGPRKAIQDHAADRVVLVRCSPELSKGTDELDIMTPFGNVHVTYPGCPNVATPSKIEMPKALSSADQSKLSDYINLMMKDRKTFVEEYIVTGKFDKLLK